LAIADLIWYRAGDEDGLPDLAFVGAEKFSEIYTTLHCYFLFSDNTITECNY